MSGYFVLLNTKINTNTVQGHAQVKEHMFFKSVPAFLGKEG